jgi:hypothetical protein
LRSINRISVKLEKRIFGDILDNYMMKD